MNAQKCKTRNDFYDWINSDEGGRANKFDIVGQFLHALLEWKHSETTMENQLASAQKREAELTQEIERLRKHISLLEWHQAQE